ncbi:MAG: homocysteine S-methyltransferase family protein [Clostridia bacterium]|nr:homocysteine S-methyltransferase family protein [Clostridia bacterium]
MTILEKLKRGQIILDGATGTQLQAAGLPLGVLPEEWNITHKDAVTAIHRAYFQAGSDVVCANTFGANCLKFGERTEEVIRAAIACADGARKGLKDKFIALDIGPCGKLLKPLGGLDFEDAVNIFKRTVKAGAEAGADLIFIETMNDVYELKAAVIAAKETCDLPVFVSAVFGSDCKTMTGTSPEAFAALAEGLGADALGINCSLAPAEMTEVVSRILKVSSTPVIVKPNAGLPQDIGGKTVYSLSADGFASQMKPLAEAGAQILGGCCGTTPEYIEKLVKAVGSVAVKPVEEKGLTVISSYTHARYFGGAPVLIGERINPTGKKRLKQALKENDIGYILNEAVTQAEKGAHVLDVNVGLPEIDEPEVLERCVCEIQAVTDLPLQIDTSDHVAMERAMRRYNGVPLVNSVNGKAESMCSIFPLVKKYGGAVICLTLDENGIPPTAEGRVKIAEKIIKEAARYGILRGQLIFDTLAMAVSADQTAANSALDALDIIRHKLGCNTSLGVSNISFGLPQRDFINSTFFAMALARGLSAAIYNPNSQEMTKTYKAFAALSGADENCAEYVEYASSVNAGEITFSGTVAEKKSADGGLKYCIEKGLKDEAKREAAKLLKDTPPLDVINDYVIPALDEVGKGFEQKRVFLPQLLMSAEAASTAFAEIKTKLNPADNAKKLKIVLATVKGDIHDIGKNIVSTLLSNYGFTVLDLGRDVPPEAVLEGVKKSGAQLVGLSALMTTTVRSMKETVELLHNKLPQVKICVGGAVLNAEYARDIGADRYCKDAMDTVRYAEELESGV